MGEEEKYVNSKHNLGKEIIKFYLQKPTYLKFCYFDKYENLILATNLVYVNEAGKGIKKLLTRFKKAHKNNKLLTFDKIYLPNQNLKW